MPNPGAYDLEIFDTRGALILRRTGTGPEEFESPGATRPGVYSVKLKAGSGLIEAFNINLAD